MTSTRTKRGRLGELLVGRELISESDLGEALSRQVIHGGRLGSNLIEQGSVSIEAVADGLSYQLGVPAADLQLVMIEESTLATLPASICDKYKILPLRIKERTLHLAMQDPWRQDVIDHLAKALQVRIQPYVVPQLRLLYALERFYGIDRPKRYLRQPKASQTPTAGDQAHQRNYLSPTVTTSTHRAVSPSPGADPLAAGTLTNEFQLVYLDDVPRAAPPTEDPRGKDATGKTATNAAQESLAPLANTAEVVAELARASDRQSVVTCLVKPLFPTTTLSLLLLPRGELAVTLAASGTELPVEQVCGLVVPLNAPSSIQHAWTSKSPVRCDAGQDALQPMMATYLRAPSPIGACVLPISINGKVVNLLCVQTATPATDEMLASLEQVAQAGTAAYERLISRRQRS